MNLLRLFRLARTQQTRQDLIEEISAFSAELYI